MKVKRPLHALYQRVEKLTINILASTKSRFYERIAITSLQANKTLKSFNQLQCGKTLFDRTQLQKL